MAKPSTYQSGYQDAMRELLALFDEHGADAAEAYVRNNVVAL